MLAIGMGACQAQEADMAALVTRSLRAMNEERWGDALIDLNAVTSAHQVDPLEVYGPPFGVLWYRRGICELQLGHWQDAITSFERCYLGFPNTAERGGNTFHKKALLKWSEAAMGAGDWDLSIRMARKFLEERNKDADLFPQGIFHVNLAICHYKLGDLAAGSECLETAVRNRDVFPTSDAAIVTGLQELVTAAVDQGNEPALLDFLSKNRVDLSLPAADACLLSPMYLKMAADATAAGFNRAAMSLYGFVPDDGEALEAVNRLIASLGERPALLDGNRFRERESLQALRKRLEDAQQMESSAGTLKEVGIALLQEKLGNLRGALVMYQHLERHHGRADVREDYLYQVVRLRCLLGEGMEAQNDGLRFLETFPKSERVPEVKRKVLGVLFQEGLYERSRDFASSLIGDYPAGAHEREFCLYVLGASLYYTKDHKKAQPLLDEYASTVPDGPQRLSALFFQASNRVALEDWNTASSLLDAFLEKYPAIEADPLIAYARYERACCHAAMDETEAALVCVGVLLGDPAGHSIADKGWLLKGDLLQRQHRADEAKAAYEKALQLAREMGHEELSEEAAQRLAEWKQTGKGSAN